MRWILVTLCTLSCLAASGQAGGEGGRPAAFRPPLMGDFMGLNVHTVQFRPELYKPVCRLVRDYHPVHWDLGDDTARPLTFPMAANGVDWSRLYGGWTRDGYAVDACLMFESIKPGAWKDVARDARAYGEAFARYFGPSGRQPWVTSVEIGNEPADYSAEQYRVIFEAMARGVRAGDPKLKIATCGVMTGTPDKWSKPVSAIEGLNDLYDVLNVHSYAFKSLWPTWRRSYPEDPSIRWLKDVDGLLRWRDAHAPGKEVWVTEFGYDSSTKRPAPDGQWKDWAGVSDEEQAWYTVRSFLVLSAMPLERAYLYFFNDKDEPQLHGASGITRNYQPKPSFYAMAHLYRTLGDCRFSREVVREAGAVYCFEYAREGASGGRVYVAWSPTGAREGPRRRVLPLGREVAGRVTRVERMPMGAEPAKAVDWKVSADGAGVELEVGPAPVYVFVSGR